MKKIIILNIVFFVLASFCFADEETKQTKPMQIRKGDSFTITLRANTSTGYQWKLAVPLDESMLQLVHTKYIAYRRKRLGADGKQLWTFKALKEGQTNIFFKYVRDWEKDKPPQKKVTIAVNIK